MPALSAFAPIGMMSLSGAPSHAENLHRSMIASYSTEFDVTEGSHMDTTCFADAMAMARARYAIEHAAAQATPDAIDVLLPPLEEAYGLIPGPYDTILDRRAAYRTRRRIPKPPSRILVETALQELLGDDFLALVATPIADAVLHPTMFADPPMLLLSTGVTRKVVRFLDPQYIYAGNSDPIRYEVVLESGGLLELGDNLIVESETLGLAETTSVLEIGEIDGVPYFVGFFEKAHSEGVIAAQQPWPAWASTKRHSLVVLTPSASSDATARRKVNDYMNRTMRATSTWSIVSGAAGVTGVHTIGTSSIGAQSLGSVGY